MSTSTPVHRPFRFISISCFRISCASPPRIILLTGLVVGVYTTVFSATPRYAIGRVNSKATLKVPLGALFPHIPAALHDEVKKSRFYAERSGALIIQSGDSRRQSDNVEACYRKWYESMVSVGKAAIPGETSAEQKKKVKEL